MRNEAPRYRHRIHIQAPAIEQDSETGAAAVEWSTVYLDSDTPLDSVPAEVLTGPGREFRAAETQVAECAARIQFRWFPGLAADMRILWDGRTFAIQAIETDATGRREYRVRCRDGVSDGQ